MEYNQHVLVSHYTVTYTLCILIFTGTIISKLHVQLGSSSCTDETRPALSFWVYTAALYKITIYFFMFA